MTIPFCTSGQLGVNLSDVFTPSTSGYPYKSDVPGFALGQQITATDNSVWTYIKYGVGGSTGLGFAIVFDEDFLGVMMSNSVGGIGDKIGIAPAAAIVGDFGWVQVYGTCDAIQSSAALAANTALTSGAVAGVMTTAGTHAITGIVLTTARGAGQGNAPGELNYPTVTS